MKNLFSKRTLILTNFTLFFFLTLGLNARTRTNGTANPFEVDQAAPKQIPGMKLVWHDEFDKDGKPDASNWAYEYGFVRNRELQWYQPQNAYCEEGRLLIKGKKERVDNPYYNPQNSDWRTNSEYANYSSSCLITKGLQEWTGPGYYEFRARIDTTGGAWPAIWLLGTNSNWPFCGEIDVMEFYRINNISTILANAAWGSNDDYSGEWDSAKTPISELLKKDPDWVKKFHIWGMKWDKTTIQISIDGTIINTIELNKTINPDGTNPFLGDQKYYILLNLAIGSNGGTPMDSKFPITFEVDYVRVYKNDSYLTN
ncbi:MAG TPA: glycoside hydrolase family 16 protein [Sunxiuqinia sp.]|nr:glycoside hydrolase family 16 protein [Sunxiuqinia sp.]